MRAALLVVAAAVTDGPGLPASLSTRPRNQTQSQTPSLADLTTMCWRTRAKWAGVYHQCVMSSPGLGADSYISRRWGQWVLYRVLRCCLGEMAGAGLGGEL